MDPMALLQYQFLMARAAEYRSIATRQAMIANARMGGFTAVGDAATAHAPELDKVRFIPMFSARGRSANFYARLDLRRRRAVADDTPLESPPQIHLLQQMQKYVSQPLLLKLSSFLLHQARQLRSRPVQCTIRNDYRL